MPDLLYGGIEAGGTKFVCVAASGPHDIRARVRIDTTTPEETLRQVVAFFKTELQKSPIESIGIGSFGPLDLNPASPTFGYITTTPKPGWLQSNLVGIIRQSLNLPVRLDTDVNVAAMGEAKWGMAQGLTDFVYLTAGTGIGGGAVSGGKLVHGLMHPEMGHMLIRRDQQKDPFQGCCPFHGDCWEGLAGGAAIKARWGIAAEDLPDDHPAWALEAHYLAQGIMNLICVFSPQRIILGGGISKRAIILPLVRQQLGRLLNNYFQFPASHQNLEDYIINPGLGDLSGVLGAVALAQENR